MKNNTISLKRGAFILALFFLVKTYAGAPAHAQAASEITATPEVFNEPGAKLLITEVNLKNKTADWVELYYESPTGKPFNLNNFQFKDDNVFKKITGDYWLTSKEYYLLQFKNADPDDQSSRVLNTTRAGLTGTTEQILLLDPDGKIMDALCWASTTPTADEIKNMDELFQQEGWVSANASSCFDSTKISTNQSLIRINPEDTNSVNDWSVTDDITPGQNNDIISISPVSNTTASQTSTSAASSSPATPKNASASTAASSKTPGSTTPATTSKKTSTAKASTTRATTSSVSKKTPPKTATAASTTKKSSSKSAKPKYKNGDLSQNIIISEIFPHAATDDRNNEWIELTNTGDEDANLGNWQIDDQEGGSKPYIIPDTVTLAAKSSLLIKAPDSKLSLSNTKDSVRLFDPDGKLLQTVDYEEAPKEQSYAWITIIQSEIPAGDDTSATQTAADIGPKTRQWLWENKPTPGEPNAEYLELTGTISGEPDFGQTYTFPMQTADGHEYTVMFDEALIAGPLAKATFTKSTQIKILAVADSPNALFLKKYEITGTSQPPQTPEEQSSPWYLLGLVPPGSAGFWYGLKKIKKIVLK